MALASRLFAAWAPSLQAAALFLGTPLSLQGGTDVEGSAHRWKPTSTEGRRLTVIAFWGDESFGFRYFVLKGNPFGLASAVLNYDRGAELLVAILRCFVGATCSHFFDDRLSVEPFIALGSAQINYVKPCKPLSVHLDKDKHMAMSKRFLYVGVAFDLR